MPRKGARKTLSGRTESKGASFKVESAAAGATVDVLDTDFTTNFGYAPTTEAELLQDYRFQRTSVTTSSEEAADTIGITRVARNGGGTGWTVTFSAAAASGKKVGVRVIQA